MKVVWDKVLNVALARRARFFLEHQSPRLQFLAPAVLLVATTWLASACASGAGSLAADRLSASIAEAGEVARLLPSEQVSRELKLADPQRLSPRPNAAGDPSDEALGVASPGKGEGPAILEHPSEEADAEVGESPRPVSLAAPLCAGISAYIVTVFDDPRYSIATLSSDPESQGTRRRVGQEYGDYKVVSIDFNPRHMSSAVWLENSEGQCQVQLRTDHPNRQRVQRAAVLKHRRQMKARYRREQAAREKREKALAMRQKQERQRAERKRAERAKRRRQQKRRARKRRARRRRRREK